MRLISFGKKVENLHLSVINKIIGSDFSTFEEKIKINEKIAFVCCSKVWGSATVVSNVEQSHEIIWKDKLYPYRAKIDDIRIFKSPFAFNDYEIDRVFREKVGKQWAYKILFTPGELPIESISLLNKVFKEQESLSNNMYEEFFELNFKIAHKVKMLRLGLKYKD